MHNKEYLDMLCNTGDGVFIVDANQRIIRWNKSAEEIFGHSGNDVQNRDCFRVISGRLLPDKVHCSQHCKIHSGVLQGALQKNFDVMSRASDGSPLWLNMTIQSPPDNTEPFVAHIVRDITREKTVELALEQLLANLGVGGPMPKEASADRRMLYHLAAASDTLPDKAPAALSARETEILTWLAEGLSTKALAQKLNISPFTARNHIQNILMKLNLHSKAQAVSYAFKKGIL